MVDGKGNVATYTYDAVGNLLSITRSTGGVGAPTVTGITPNSGAAGATVNVSLTGTNLTGASVSTSKPGIAVSHVQTTATAITAAFTYVAGPNQSIKTITPTPGLINIPRNAPVTVSFARPVDRATITTSSFALTQGATPVAGTFSSSSATPW